MAIQYYMRAYNTVLTTYVDWIVNDTPDITGEYSGYPTNQLTNIIVNKTITSKVDNFLKPNQSLNGLDGYYFHINSYDWLRAVSPINPPTNLTGLAVERGINLIGSITGATNTTPILITSSSPHALSNGALVTITDVQGNVAANGTFPITVTGIYTFTLNGSKGSGTYTSNGSIFVPKDFSTITWDETNNIWRFVTNTNGDGSTLGSHQSLKVNNFFIDGYESLGSNPATTGSFRIANNQFITARDQSNSNNIQLIGADNQDKIKIGLNSNDLVYLPGNFITDGYIAHNTAGSNFATVGFIREKNNTSIIAFKNQSSTNNIIALSSNSTDNIILGDSLNLGINYNVSTGTNHSFQVNSNTTFEVGETFARFTSTVIAPTINQVSPGVGISSNGQTLTIQAQNGGSGSTTGGIASIMSGVGGSFNGTVDLSTGSVLKVRIHPTVSPISDNNNSIQIFENKVRFDSAQTLPRIMQDDVITSSAVGNSLYFQAQNATGSSSTGGNAIINSGTGTSIDGYVSILNGNVENTRFISNKLVYLVGQRQKTTSVSSGPYNILASDFNILVNTGTAITVNLPAGPATGDTYRIKDSTGTASTNNITISGNGNNIEGVSSKTINVNYDKLMVLFNSVEWIIL